MYVLNFIIKRVLILIFTHYKNDHYNDYSEKKKTRIRIKISKV